MLNYPIFIYGAGGMAREVLTIYEDMDNLDKIIGFVEDNSNRVGSLINGKPVYDVNYMSTLGISKKIGVVIAIGSTKRVNVIKRLKTDKFLFEKVVHPSALLHKTVQIGYGSIICAGVILTTNIIIKNHVILNLSSSISHDSIINSFTTISSGARISGNVKIGERVFIGTNASINEGVKIGDGAIIGAGSVVTEEVPELALITGVPGKIKKIYNNFDERPW